MDKEKKPNYNFLAFITVFFMIGMMGTRPLVSILSNELYATPMVIGIIIAMFPVLPFFFSVHLGKFVAYIGSRIPLIMSSFLGSLSLMIPFMFHSLTGLVISQIIAGICNTLYVIAAQSYVGQTRDADKRDVNVMKFSLGVAIGTFIGPFIGGFTADWVGSAQAFFVLGTISLISVFLSLFIVEYREKEEEKEKEIKENPPIFALFKIVNVRRAILISTLILMGKDTFTSFFPLIAVEMGLSSSAIGVIVSLHAFAGILIRWFMPALLQRYTRNGVIISSIVISGILMAIIPISGQVLFLGVVSFLLGMGLGIGQPLSISVTLYALPKRQVSQGLGLRITANRFVQMTSPLLFGLVAQVINLASVFLITGILYVVGATKSKIKEEQQLPY